MLRLARLDTSCRHIAHSGLTRIYETCKFDTINYLTEVTSPDSNYCLASYSLTIGPLPGRAVNVT